MRPPNCQKSPSPSTISFLKLPSNHYPFENFNFPFPFFISSSKKPKSNKVYLSKSPMTSRSNQSFCNRILTASPQASSCRVCQSHGIDHPATIHHMLIYQISSIVFPFHSSCCAATLLHICPRLGKKICLGRASFRSVCSLHNDYPF